MLVVSFLVCVCFSIKQQIRSSVQVSLTYSILCCLVLFVVQQTLWTVNSFGLCLFACLVPQTSMSRWQTECRQCVVVWVYMYGRTTYVGCMCTLLVSRCVVLTRLLFCIPPGEGTMAQQGNRTVRASGSGPSPPHLPLSNKTKTTTPQPPQTSWETTTPAEVDRTNELEKKEEPPGGTPGEKGATRSSTGNAHRPPGQGARKSTAAPRPPPLSKEYFMSSFSKSRDSNRQSVPTVKSKDTSIQPSSHSPKSSSPISVPSGRKELYSPRSSPTSASTDDRRATYSFNTVRTDHVGGPETGKGHQQHRLAPKGNKSISDVSRDRYTKQKAVMVGSTTRTTPIV